MRDEWRKPSVAPRPYADPTGDAAVKAVGKDEKEKK